MGGVLGTRPSILMVAQHLIDSVVSENEPICHLQTVEHQPHTQVHLTITLNSSNPGYCIALQLRSLKC